MEQVGVRQVLEDLAGGAYGEGAVSEVIRPAAVIPEPQTREILFALSERDVGSGGVWRATPQRWQRYDRPWEHVDGAGVAALVGTIQVMYGTPTRFSVTIYRATITRDGLSAGWSVERLCDEALGFGGLSLASCPRASLKPPPKPFHMV